MTPRTLRGALDLIQDMLSGRSYSEDLWAVMTGLRGPDSRNRSIKNATTAIIRSAAFPKHPTSASSVFGVDSKKLARRRKDIWQWVTPCANHFREHAEDAFDALGLDLYEMNGGARGTQRVIRLSRTDVRKNH
jgi:hypothetical protein